MAVTLDGNTDVADLGDNFDLGSAATYMVWVNPSAIGNTTGFFSKFNGAQNSDFALYTVSSAGSVNFRASGAAVADGFTAAGAIANSAWTNLAVVYDGGGAANADKLKIYVNGTDTALTFSNSFDASYAGSTSAFNVGNFADANVGCPGDYAHMKIWMGVALTAGEILTEAYRWRPNRMQDISVWTAFEDVLAGGDYSGGGKTATITGGISVVTAPPVDYGGTARERRNGGYRTGFTRRTLPRQAPTFQPPRHTWFGGLVH